MNLNEIMSQEYADAFDRAFVEFFKADVFAIKLAKNYLYIAHVWDDLIDEQKTQPNQVNTAFKLLMLEIPSNPIFQRHANKLLPVLTSAYLQWMTANCFEKAETNLDKAYMLRASVYQVFVALAEIIGGLSWAEEVSPSIFALYGETFESFKLEVADNA